MDRVFSAASGHFFAAATALLGYGRHAASPEPNAIAPALDAMGFWLVKDKMLFI